MDSEEVLRRLSIGDPVLCAAFMSDVHPVLRGSLDRQSLALLRLGASIGTGTIGPVLNQRVGEALAAGVDFDEVVASLVALIPVIGIERAVAAAPAVAQGLGYDVDAEVERLD
jgi:4-carboxymuconolactone decarboxylase